MTRWSDADRAVDGAAYDARFAALAAKGADVHGEARLCTVLMPTPALVLDAGCGTGRVAIRLAELGYVCVGVDVDDSMLERARLRAPDLLWLQADLADLADLAPGPIAAAGVTDPFDLVVAAGNVIPLVAAGTEAVVVAGLAALLAPGGLLVAGFGLHPDYLPIPEAPVSLAGYDAMCSAAGLVLEQRFATWSGDPYDDGGYAVSVHRRA